MSLLKFVELFAGAGGLSEGFIRQGYEPIAFVEQDQYCCQTLKTRLVYHELKKQVKLNFYYDYLQGILDREHLYQKIDPIQLEKVICESISSQTLEPILSQIKDLNLSEEVDLVLGGPPCQAYSLIGRAQNRHKQTDERLYLYQHYHFILSTLKPKCFVFENVPGLLSINKGELFQEILEGFKTLGYKIYYDVLNASDFSVLQSRKRVIVIGSKEKEIPISIDKSESNMTVNDLLADLTELKAGTKNNSYRKAPSDYLNKTKIRQKKDVLTWHEARAHNQRDLNIYKQVVSHWNKHNQRLSYREVSQDLKTHKNQKSFLDRFKIVAGNLATSHTMVAHIAKDGHHYIHPDIKQNRSLSVREAARIQSFPDNYFFEGSRSAAFTQIGNAVPPLLSEGIAKQIKSTL